MDAHLRRLDRAASQGCRDSYERLERERGRTGVRRFAVLSDVHANLEALSAVFADIDRLGIRDVLCLGDLVGFGPDPVPCVDLVRERCGVVLRGDFDDRLLHKPHYPLNAPAAAARRWLVDQFRPGAAPSQERWRRWRFLHGLPLHHRADGDQFVHGSPRDPLHEFLMRHEVALGGRPKYQQILSTVERRLFVGHSHEPFAVDDRLEAHTPASLGDVLRVPDGGKAIVNVGSVGQPRDRDPRACYVTVEGPEVRWRRVAYDLEHTAAKVRALPALGPELAARLYGGT